MYHASYEDGTTLARAVTEATSFAARSKGMLGRDHIPPEEGMLFRQCESIHMFGMRTALDVLFLDTDDRVVKIFRELQPWKMAFGGRKATHCLELAPGILPADRPAIGELIRFDDAIT